MFSVYLQSCATFLQSNFRAFSSRLSPPHPQPQAATVSRFAYFGHFLKMECVVWWLASSTSTVILRFIHVAGCQYFTPFYGQVTSRCMDGAHLLWLLVAPVVKNPPATQEMQWTQGRSLGQEDPLEEEWQPTSVSCLENSMDRGARWATVHGVIKCLTWQHTLLHYYGSSVFNILSNCQTVFQSGCTVFEILLNTQGFRSCLPSLTLVVRLIVSLTTNAVQHLPMCLLALQTAFWKKCLVNSQTHFQTGLFVFSLFSCKSFCL